MQPEKLILKNTSYLPDMKQAREQGYWELISAARLPSFSMFAELLNEVLQYSLYAVEK